ncbi:MAG: elongation factor P [Betaproteobacteria bacterium]|nr:elongation factor P [Betaproteobacteria bacterium]
MIAASDLKAGTVINLDGELHGIISAEHHAGAGKFGSMMFARVRNLRTGHMKELRYHPEDKLEDVELERREVEYLYTDGAEFHFMNPDTFEQISLPREAVGAHEKFLLPNTRVPVELHEGRIVSVAFPAAVELKVVTAPPGLREHDTAYKTIALENGTEVLAPQFIKEGDVVKIEVATGKYLERVRREGRKL